MTSISRNARVAGVLYLLLVLAAPIRLLYIPSKLFVSGNASATAANIAAHESLFRFGIVSDLFCGSIVIFLSLALYRLFKEVDQNLAGMMVILGGVLPAAIDFLIVLNDLAVLLLVGGADFLSVFDKTQLDALALLFLRLHHQQVLAAQILWGLWLFPLGILVYKSRFLPRFLSVWLILNGIAYVVQSVTSLMLPHCEDVVSKFAIPALLGEVALMLWLLIMGARERSVRAALDDHG